MMGIPLPSTKQSLPIYCAIVSLSVLLGAVLSGCAWNKRQPQVDLGQIYNEAAQRPDYQRNPVIVVPGILGSRLVDSQTQEVVWGELGTGGANPWQTRSLTEIALPMGESAPLSQLRDQVHADGPLDQLTFKLFGIPIHVNAYAQILATLGVGGYRDQHFHGKSQNNEVDYGNEHFTCFQFSYDWRRDISETAGELHRFIEASEAKIREQYRLRYGIENANIRFDIVAHSMGGLITRYYLRYGDQPLPEDGSLPALNWAGANRVGRAVLVGTPNGGSAEALIQLKEGMQLIPGLPRFPPAVLGTMPAVYQLLPRARHQPLVTKEGQGLDLYEPDTWKQLQWGLADPNQDSQLRKLLPEMDQQARRRIALNHQHKCLVRARQLHESLDISSDTPSWLDVHLYAGDAKPTLEAIVVDSNSSQITEKREAAGDGSVTRNSAQLFEPLAARRYQGIDWTSKTFLSTDHLGLTRDRTFVDNVLDLLLNSKRNRVPPFVPATASGGLGIRQ